MTTQLTVYNNSLLLCGERFLASLTEEREPRRLLDQAWDGGGGVKTCLEMGQWNFAMRTVQIDYDTSIEPDFGYTRAFEKPSDWVLTSSLCQDEYFKVPLLQFEDEAGYWYAELDTLYVRYVSNAVTYGLDLNKWPESFREVVEAYFAKRIVRKLTGSQEKEDAAEKHLKKTLSLAKSRAAMAGPTRFAPPGSWSRSRAGYNRNDRSNNSGNLIG